MNQNPQTNPNLARDILLPDGRLLGYAEFGKPDGHPVLYFHGAPSSRLEPMSFLSIHRPLIRLYCSQPVSSSLPS